MRTAIQSILDIGVEGSVGVGRVQSEHLAENGFVYYLTFYDTGDIAMLTASFMDGACANDFEVSQSVSIMPMVNGALHSSNCDDCTHGINHFQIHSNSTTPTQPTQIPLTTTAQKTIYNGTH